MVDRITDVALLKEIALNEKFNKSMSGLNNKPPLPLPSILRLGKWISPEIIQTFIWKSVL